MHRAQVLATLLNNEQRRSLAEIGCKEGRVTGAILRECPQVQVYACDPWIVQPPKPDRLAETYEDWDFAKIEREFEENTGPYKDRLEFHRCIGDLMAPQVPEVECVFIDARHDYESVLNDIAVWYPKVKPGGWISGHDFNHKWPGVQRAVADNFDLLQVACLPDSIWLYRKPC